VLDRTQAGENGLPATKGRWKSYLPRRRWFVAGSILALAVAAVLLLTTAPENVKTIEHAPEKASAEATQDQAEVELAKTTVRAGVAGRTEQFVL
jgi:uncharacterized membrane protein YdfJ with MMPL/SSD domain